MAAARPGETNPAASPSVAASGQLNDRVSRGPSIAATVDQAPAQIEHAQLLSRHLGPPAQVEGYTIERCLGAGAFGTVWLATQRSTGKLVAIKFYEHRGGLDWAFLNREVEKLAALYTDRDIVQLIDVGWDASPPYYVMEYLERGSLEQLLHQGPMPVAEAVRVVREVAQALVHAHGRGILHCDLKPANVLLDNDWKVRLADFGQSRLSYEQLPALGTLFYMAPEQADLKASPDARWDVYAIGALLYQLLTGSPPYRTAEAETRLREAPNVTSRLEEYQRILLAAPRPTAHRKVRGVDRALADVVERCLEREPARRFPNAQAVLDAIDRRDAQRARRPLVALGLVAPVLLLAATVILGVAGWSDAVRQSEESLVRAVQAGNVYAAQGVASTVLLQLRRLSTAVERTCESPELRDLLARRDQAGLQTFIERTHAAYNDPRTGVARNGQGDAFESWVILDSDGLLLARAPLISEVIGRNYAWRDYFRGTMDQAKRPDAEPVYISRVIVSEADNLHKSALAAPVRENGNADAPTLGLVVATITTGTLPLHDERRTAVLVGRWDTNPRPGAAQAAGPRSDHLILRHPAMKKGDPAVEVKNDVLDRIQAARLAGRSLPPEEAMDDNYIDPLGEHEQDFAGQWLAGFAPVGNTEFVVVVEQRYDKAIAPVEMLAGTLAWRGWGALSVGVFLLASMWYFVQRAMSRGERVWLTLSGGRLSPGSGGTEPVSAAENHASAARRPQ